LAEEKKEKEAIKGKASKGAEDKKETIKGKASKGDEDRKEDFKYIVRIANTDIDGEKPVVHALTAIKGVGNRIAEIVINKTGLPRKEKIGNLSDEDVEKLESYILDMAEKNPGWLLNKQRDVWTGEDIHIYGPELDMRHQEDINILKKIR
jgi:small subunit ribosomal protein S13